jgi:putative membrane protein
MYWLTRFILNILVVLILGYLLRSSFPIFSIEQAAIFIIILTILNWTLVPIVRVLTLPLNFLTLGLLGIILNGLAIMVTGSILGLSIGLIPGLIVAFTLGVVNAATINGYNGIGLK